MLKDWHNRSPNSPLSALPMGVASDSAGSGGELERAMAELKTKRTDADVPGFVAGIGDQNRRQDAGALLELMHRVTGSQAALWGSYMVGFGEYGYRYATGRTGTWFTIGFAPRKQNLTLYLYGGFEDEQTAALLQRLGPHSTGKGCLYVKRLDDVDLVVLEDLLRRSVARAADEAPVA